MKELDNTVKMSDVTEDLLSLADVECGQVHTRTQTSSGSKVLMEEVPVRHCSFDLAHMPPGVLYFPSICGILPCGILPLELRSLSRAHGAGAMVRRLTFGSTSASVSMNIGSGGAFYSSGLWSDYYPERFHQVEGLAFVCHG